MQHLLSLLGALMLCSCSLFQGAPKFSEPSRRDLVGNYRVEKISRLVPHRSDLKRVALTLSPDGTFRLNERKPGWVSPLIPETSGRWSLKQGYGLDLGSNPSWVVWFVPSSGEPCQAFCLEDAPPHRLMFVDSSRRQIGDLLIMKRVD